ncbi:p-hydroxybenzoic acid efflux pump subunit AaeA [Acinetobacter baumannii]|nr:p-hydroxybenzoic acid efflux pump subunit AaeA [Acinetobacter baumannii]
MNQLELKKVIRPVILIVALMIAVYTIVHLWNYYNAAPWTRDGRVRGDVIQVSSDVAGLVTEVLVQDNQTKRSGAFKIDVSRRALDVEQAKSDLAKAKAAYAQAQAGLAQANLIKSSTNIKLRKPLFKLNGWCNF